MEDNDTSSNDESASDKDYDDEDEFSVDALIEK